MFEPVRGEVLKALERDRLGCRLRLRLPSPLAVLTLSARLLAGGDAGSKAEAVREFWTYVDKLGPSQLPAFVWPRGDELAMQAYLLGERVNLDPEEDEVDEPG